MCDIVARGLVLPTLPRVLKERGVAALLGRALLPVFPAATLLSVGVVVFFIGEGLFNASRLCL